MLQQKISNGECSNWYGPMQALLTLLLAYPTHRQRSQHPHLLQLWQDEVRNMVRHEKNAGWPPQLWEALKLVVGDNEDNAKLYESFSWQERFVAKLYQRNIVNYSPEVVGSIAEECLAHFPSQKENCLSVMSVQLLKGELDGFMQKLLERSDFLSVHLTDVLWHSGILAKICGNDSAKVHSSSLLNYANYIQTATPSLWNLSADYYWASSIDGKQKLEEQLFSWLRSCDQSDFSSGKPEAIINLAQSFGLDLVADALHVMIAEKYVADNQINDALYHALVARQSALVYRICDKALRSHIDQRTSLDIIEEGQVQFAKNSRLTLLLQYQRFLELKSKDMPMQAWEVLSNQILEDPDLTIPSYFRLQLLRQFLGLSYELPEVRVTQAVLKTLLEYMESLPDAIDAKEAQSLRVALLKQSSRYFLS